MELLKQAAVAAMGDAVAAPWLFAAVIGVAIVLLTLAAAWTSALVFDPIRRRLNRLREVPENLVVTETATRTDEGSFWAWLTPRSGEKLSGLRAQLAQGGFTSQKAMGVMYAAKLALAGFAPVGAWVVTGTMMSEPLTTSGMFAVLAGAGFLGWIAPNVYLDKRVQSRKDLLMSGFPDALDLLVACTEAGLSFNAALERVVDQMPVSNPELAEELSLVNAEIRAGLDRATALRNLADRTGLDEVRGLVSLITHSTRLGSGIAGTLRIYAEEFRDRRMQRAEEQAAMVGTKMIFPLILCMFPSFFIVAIGPAALGIMRSLSGSGLGG